MIPLSYEENESYKNQKFAIYAKKEISTDNDYDNDNDNKKYHKVRDHCHFTVKYRGDTHNICNLRYKTPKKSS